MTKYDEIFMIDYASSLENLIKRYRKEKRPIDINFREMVNISNFDRLTHYIHSYPAKLLQCIPIFFINNSLLLSKHKNVVYDPFCGSGTVALEALYHGKQALVRDINPLATLITRVKCTYIDNGSVWDGISQIDRNIKKARWKNHNIPNQDFWFDEVVYRKLSRLWQAVNFTDNQNLADFFKICFSTVARKMSYADPKISVPVKLNPGKYPDGHKNRIAAERHIHEIESGDVFAAFKNVVAVNIKRVATIKNMIGNNITIETVDAKAEPLNEFKGKVDLIVTSPPYPGAQKYIRSSSLSLNWLELHKGSLTPLKKQVIGREEVSTKLYTGKSGCKSADKQLKKIAVINKERAAVAESYLKEMRLVFKSCWNHLVSGGYMALVAANNLFCGLELYTQKYLCEIAIEEGFVLELELMDDIKSYGLMTKRNKTAGVISREHVALFRKP